MAVRKKGLLEHEKGVYQIKISWLSKKRKFLCVDCKGSTLPKLMKHTKAWLRKEKWKKGWEQIWQF